MAVKRTLTHRVLLACCTCAQVHFLKDFVLVCSDPDTIGRITRKTGARLVAGDTQRDSCMANRNMAGAASRPTL